MAENHRSFSKPDGKYPGLATHDDIKRVFGDVDESKLIDIMNLHPTIKDLEQASIWLGGDPDVFGSGHALQDIAGEIVSILTADDIDEARTH